MDSVKEIAMTFCAAAVMTAAIGLLGGNRLEKSVRYIIALTLICSVISVAVNKDFKFFISSTPNDTPSYNTDSLYEYQAEYLIGDILGQRDIQFENITAKATKKEDGSIVINEIEISGCKQSQSAIEILRGIGIDCNIRVTE